MIRACQSYLNSMVLAGELPLRALNLALKWAQRHQKELIENWKRSLDHKVLNYIEPLD